ncbi:hypothetical protein DY000_02021705 [Brassica cretica]|uniref:Uncharacterized protein n=2 Tax=Brassica cretica TaxID=69181 RepID=A0ABQ7E928_BRACR|nr:hypothetical protein DY000_02021705 [Brassica cretica]
MDGDFPTVRLSLLFDTIYNLELSFQFHRFEVNRHPVSEVMLVLLKSGTYISVPGTTKKIGFLGSSKKESACLCMIRKSTREVSIDTLQAAAIDRVNQKSIDSNTTPSIDITCEKTEKVEGTAIPDNSTVTEEDDFELKPIFITLMEQRHFHGFPHEQAMDHIDMFEGYMVEGDEQHVSGGLSRVKKARTEDTTSTSIDTSTATSIDSTTSTSTNGTTSTSIDGTTSESIAHTIPASIDEDSCFQSTPLEIHGRSSCPQDIADSA